MMMGISELLLLVFVFGNQLGLPLGMPPGPDVPYLSAVAPAECLFYAQWNGTAPPNPNGNSTERWLAQEAMQTAGAKIRAALFENLEKAALAEEPFQQELASLLTDVAEYSWSHATAVFLADAAQPTELYGGIVIQCDPAFREQLQQRLTALHTKLPANWKLAQINVADQTFQSLAVSDLEFPLEVSYGVAGEFAYFAWGPDALARIWQAGQQSPPAWLQQMKSELAVPRIASVSYLNVAGLIKLRQSTLPERPDDGLIFEGSLPEILLSPSVLQQSGLEWVDSLQSVTGLDEAGFVARHRLAIREGLRGWLQIMDAAPLSERQLELLPGHLDFGLAVRISPPKLLEFFAALVAEDGESLDEPLQQFQETFGLDFRRDLLGQWDGTLVLSTPVDVANPTSGFLLQLGVEDEMAFSDTFTQFNTRLEEVLTEMGGGKLQRREFAGVEIWEYEFGDGFFNFSIYWCLSDGLVRLALDQETMQESLQAARDQNWVQQDVRLQQLLQAGRAEQLGNPSGILIQDTAQLIREGLSMSSMFAEEFGEGGVGFDLDDLPSADILAGGLDPALVVWYRTPGGFEIRQRQSIPSAAPGATVAAGGLATVPALLGNALRAKRMVAENNLRSIVLAMHNYHDAFNGLPIQYSVDAGGKPLLSWRVHLLPYLGYTELYEQFHLDEPWDSDHNRALLAEIPAEYQHPKLELPAGQTVYLATSGVHAVLRPQAQGDRAVFSRNLEFLANKDGTSLTGFIVEANPAAAVPWTQPADFDIEQPDLAGRLRGNWPGQILVGMADGSVRALTDALSDQQLLSLFAIDDGGEIDLEAWSK